MKKLLSLLVLFAGAAFAQTPQLINCAPGVPCTSSGPINTNTGDPAWSAGNKINSNAIQLYGYFNGQLYVLASGDTSGVTDRANIIAALNTLAASARLPPLFSAFAPTERLVFGPGTFYLTTGGVNILGTTNTLKVQGVWFQGAGRGETVIDYSPTASAPLFLNNHALLVKMSDMTYVGHDTCPIICVDFMWSQEQAGLSNIQDNTYQDVDWQSAWRYVFRLTGANNNSEWKFSRNVVGAVDSWLYTPPAVAATITSGSATIAATNTSAQVQVGDTGQFSASVSPLSAGTQYFVVAANSSGFSVATTSGGSAVTFTSNGTPNFNTGSDQFLNFWFDKIKFWSGTAPGRWINMSYGGSIKIRDSDISGHSPAALSYVFNLLTTASGPHAGGVMNFEVDGLRVEHGNDNSRLIHSQWTGGDVLFNNLDESSQAGNRATNNAYAFYEISNNNGPTVEYRNSQLMGVHNYSNGTSNFRFQNEMLYEGVTLLDNPTFANFITITNFGNAGGLPRIHCRNCRNLQNSNTVGYKEIVDTDLNWNTAYGGITDVKRVACVFSNSDWPFNGGSFEIRLPMNAQLVDVNYYNPSGTVAGAYNYSVQTTESTPTVLLTVAGANAATPIPYASRLISTVAPGFIMNSDAKRTLQVIDNGARTGVMTGVQCQMSYIG